jgi:hypothetical protein
MNKREVVWLIVRLMGVYFAYLAVISVFTLVGSVSMLYSLSSDGTAVTKAEPEFNRAVPNAVPPPSKVETPAEKAKNEAFKAMLLNIFLTALYAGVSFYLIAKGTILFNILNKEQEPTSQRVKESTVTTIKL